MNIDGVTSGLVLDHIRAGGAMEIYKFLNLDALDCCVAVIRNVSSKKLGKKDIIKIDAPIDLDLDMLGYLDPNVTVNIIKDAKLLEKKHLSLPKKLKNVITCKNPRCVSAGEREIDALFVLSDESAGIYRCAYCETAYPERKWTLEI